MNTTNMLLSNNKVSAYKNCVKIPYSSFDLNKLSINKDKYGIDTMISNIEILYKNDYTLKLEISEVIKYEDDAVIDMDITDIAENEDIKCIYLYKEEKVYSEMFYGNEQTEKVQELPKEPENISIKEEVYNTEKSSQLHSGIIFKMNKAWFLLFILGALGVGFVTGYAYNEIKNLYEKIEMSNEYTSLIETKNQSIKGLNALVSASNEKVQSLYSDMALKDMQIEERDDIISLYSQRAELYDKYEHVLYFGGERTDVTYDQLQFGINEMESRNIDPDLLFGLMKLESGFDETAQSSLSSARGYTQILKSTGKWLYEDVLQKGTYNHDYALDGYTNIEMCAALLGYNMERFNGNVMQTLISYNGGELGIKYYNIINSYIEANTDKSLATIQSEYLTADNS